VERHLGAVKVSPCGNETKGAYLCDLLACFKEFERWHSADTESLSKLRLLVDIDFLEFSQRRPKKDTAKLTTNLTCVN